jgi:hypothetical protein
MFSCEYVVRKKFNTQIWKNTFPCLFTWEWANKFQIGIVQCTITWGTQSCLVTKKRGSRNLTTHVLSSLDPGVHALQIGLTHTDTSTSPKLIHAFLIFLTFNDSKTDRHNSTTMTQHTSPVLYFHTDAIQRKRNSCILFTEHIHPRRYKRLFQQIHKRSLGVP